MAGEGGDGEGGEGDGEGGDGEGGDGDRLDDENVAPTGSEPGVQPQPAKKQKTAAREKLKLKKKAESPGLTQFRLPVVNLKSMVPLEKAASHPCPTFCL